MNKAPKNIVHTATAKIRMDNGGHVKVTYNVLRQSPFWHEYQAGRFDKAVMLKLDKVFYLEVTKEIYDYAGKEIGTLSLLFGPMSTRMGRVRRLADYLAKNRVGIDHCADIIRQYIRYTRPKKFQHLSGINDDIWIEDFTEAANLLLDGGAVHNSTKLADTSSKNRLRRNGTRIRK